MPTHLIKFKYRGSTLIESLVALGLIAYVLVIFSVGQTAITSNKYLRHRSFAYGLATEELEAIRNSDFSRLTNRTAADFIEVAYNIGTWKVAALADSPSSPNAYELLSPTGNPVGLTGIAIVPGIEYDNNTYEAKIKVAASSPATWQAGIFLRYHDTGNYYFVHFNATNIYFDKRVDNSPLPPLDTLTRSFATNTWYTLKVEAVGNVFNVYVDNALVLTVTDTTFTDGRFALAGMNSAHLYFDDVKIGTTLLWHFDGDGLGNIPAGWERFGLADLPDGQGKLTIEDAQAGFNDIKKVTVRVQWSERSQTKHTEIVTYVSEQNMN